MSARRALRWLSVLTLILAASACSSPISSEEMQPDAGANTDTNSPTGPEATSTTPTDQPEKPANEVYTCGDINAVPYEGRLLTRAQYQNTVAALFDGQVQGLWVESFPAENEVAGFRTNAQSHRVTSWLAEAHLNAAEAIAAQVREKLSVLAPCASSANAALSNGGSTLRGTAVSCAQTFLTKYGLRAFRRPLTAAEEQPLLSLFSLGYDQQGAAYGLELMTQALLLSPQFLYRLEAPVGTSETAADGELVDGYGLASRLSYLLWNTMPDDALFAAAQSGTLEQPEQLRAQAERLLDSPKALAAIADFAEQWLGLGALNGAVRRVPGNSQSTLALDATSAAPFGIGRTSSDASTVDSGALPDAGSNAEPQRASDATNQFSSAWRSSLIEFVTDLYARDASFSDLMLSNKVYVNPELAQLYAVDVSGPQPDADQFVGVELPEGERAGLLTQPGLMAMLAHSDQSAPILRGVFVLDALLCQPPPPAPASVDTTPPMLDPKATTRERFLQHTVNPECASCHRFIDPIGLGLENYDELGRYRDHENRLPVDASGELKGLTDEATNGHFTGALGLAERLATSSQAQACFVSKWYQYGAGRGRGIRDACTIEELQASFAASGGNLRDLLVQFVLSDAFRYRTHTAESEP